MSRIAADETFQTVGAAYSSPSASSLALRPVFARGG